jgi:hypothetical protein
MSACFEHSNFFTVNDLGPRDRTPVFDRRRATPCDVPTNSMAGTGIQKEGTGGPVDTLVLQRTEPATPTRRRFDPTTRDACECASLDPTTSFLTATTLIYAIGAGITAAAGTRLALQLLLVKGFKLYSFQLQDSCRAPALLFIVTTSPCRDWVICAPAAFLRSGSHFSGSLSGIEP